MPKNTISTLYKKTQWNLKTNLLIKTKIICKNKSLFPQKVIVTIIKTVNMKIHFNNKILNNLKNNIVKNNLKQKIKKTNTYFKIFHISNKLNLNKFKIPNKVTEVKALSILLIHLNEFFYIKL